MGWEADRVLEGIFQWGAPINIWEMELYQERNGDLGYYRIHMNLDDSPHLIERLNQKTKGPIHYYPRLIIMEGPKTRSITTTEWREFFFYNAWIYSLHTEYYPSQYPYSRWPGWTLGIAFDKTNENSTAVKSLFSSYHRMGRSSDKTKAAATP